MMIKMSVSIQGEKEVKHRFNKVIFGLEDNKPWLKRLGDECIYPVIKSTFAQQGMPRWAPLSPSYAIWKAKHYPGRGTLVLTGALGLSLISKASANSHYVLTEDRLEIGSNLDVGKWNLGLLHQMGTKKMPKRPIITDSALNIIDNKMLEFSREHLRKAINE